MPRVRVVMLPNLLCPDDLSNRTVVVFDVLRATTTMAVALSSGAPAIWAYDSLDGARAGAKDAKFSFVLAGERNAVRPADFYFGNSPGEFTKETISGRTILMATTNGTRALVAARSASHLFAGALVNARATAAAAVGTGLPITLLCSGTQGNISTEDVLGAGAVIAAIKDAQIENDSAQIALNLWKQCEHELQKTLSDTLGGHHIQAAGLAPDIAFAAQLNCFNIICRVNDKAGQLIVTGEAP